MRQPALFVGIVCAGIFLATLATFIWPGKSSMRVDVPLSGVLKQPVLLFGGDVMLSRKIGAILEEKDDFSFPFKLIWGPLRSADLAIVNLESPISDKGQDRGSLYSFRADPRAVETLASSGIDVVSLANNHMFDYGPDALLDTLERLKAAGIGFAGAGKHWDEAHTPHIVGSKGVRFAFLSYTDLLPASTGEKNASPAVALYDSATLAEDIGRAQRLADVVIVLYHFGDEYEVRHNVVQENMAHAAIDAGASVVIGHHPHVPQDSEWYKGGYIAYSLGNLVFDQNFQGTKKGLLLQVTFEGKEIKGVKEIPIAFTKEYQPYVIETSR